MCQGYRLFFFFQAEDGIRDYKVTGVQTCALPILVELVTVRPQSRQGLGAVEDDLDVSGAQLVGQQLERRPNHVVEVDLATLRRMARSEERRVGKGVDLGGRRIIKKKKKRGEERD